MSWMEQIPEQLDLEAVECFLVLRTLARTGGNRGEAATRLGISYRGLTLKLSRYREAGISVPPPPSNRALARKTGKARVKQAAREDSEC